jgi:FlaA1/EpsC-like NDP-sugar epimerase
MKAFLLFIGGIVALYLALFATLVIRYDDARRSELERYHLAPFTIVFVPWLLIFYITGLYDLRRLRNNLDFLKTLALALVINAAIAVLVFYLVPAFGITPKTNLVIFIIIFAIIEALWRHTWNRATVSGAAPNRAVLVGDGADAHEVELAIAENHQLGYAVVVHMQESAATRSPQKLADLVHGNNANLVVVPRELKKKHPLAAALYRLFGSGITVLDLDSFYESVMRKVPLADVEKTWFLKTSKAARGSKTR